MAILFPTRLFHPRAARPTRVTLWVEELESRQALSTVGPNNIFFAPDAAAGTTAVQTSPTTSGQATNTPPALTPSAGQTTGSGTPLPLLDSNGATTTAPNFLTPQNPVSPTPAQTPGAGVPANVLVPPTNPFGPPPVLSPPPTNTFNQLPPILQGSTVVPPSGPLSFADVQTITANFIAGGHTESAPNPQNPPSPRPQIQLAPPPRMLPTNTPARSLSPSNDTAESAGAAAPFSETETVPPVVVALQEIPRMLTDPGEDTLQDWNGGVSAGPSPVAIPVLVASLAAHWANRQRRPGEDEATGSEKAQDWKTL